MERGHINIEVLADSKAVAERATVLIADYDRSSGAGLRLHRSCDRKDAAAKYLLTSVDLQRPAPVGQAARDDAVLQLSRIVASRKKLSDGELSPRLT